MLSTTELKLYKVQSTHSFISNYQECSQRQKKDLSFHSLPNL